MDGFRTQTGVLILDPQPCGDRGNQTLNLGVVETMSIMRRFLLLAGLAAVLAACSVTASSTAAPARSGSPPTAGSSQPATGEIDHATGAEDVILRLDQGGGMMIRGGGATLVPPFTLFGDGTVVFRNPALELPPATGPVFRQNPMRTAKLDEEQIQELLSFAVTEGGLGTAKLQYDNPMVADAGTAIFTIKAGGLDKTVNVYALGLNDAGVPDLPARAQFQKLADRLTNFDQNGTFATDVYVPTAYRGVLIDTGGFPGEAPIEWPWTDIAPADFKGDETNGVLPTRVMTPEELAVLGIDGIEGGFEGLTVTDPDDPAKSYSFGVRPLLPGEDA
jgi:putative VirB-like lipoprotein